MNQPPNELAKNELVKILQATQIRLEEIDQTPFSDQGFSRLKEKVNEYIVQLVAESVRITKAREADSISPAYINHASRYLVSGRGSKVSKLIGIFGGVFFGAGLSTVVQMVLDNTYSTNGIIVGFIFAS